MPSKTKEQKEKEAYLVSFGEHLRQLRIKKGLTGAELSRRLFIDKPNLTRLEKGRVNPSLYFLKQIADELDVTLDKLFKGFKQ